MLMVNTMMYDFFFTFLADESNSCREQFEFIDSGTNPENSGVARICGASEFMMYDIQ